MTKKKELDQLFKKNLDQLTEKDLETLKKISYYDILGVAREAKQTDIKAAYRKMDLRYNPDKHSKKQCEMAQEIFEIISNAYNTLLDEDKRKQYNNEHPLDPDMDFRGKSADETNPDLLLVDEHSFQGFFNLNFPHRDVDIKPENFNFTIAEPTDFETCCQSILGIINPAKKLYIPIVTLSTRKINYCSAFNTTFPAASPDLYPQKTYYPSVIVGRQDSYTTSQGTVMCILNFWEKHCLIQMIDFINNKFNKKDQYTLSEDQRMIPEVQDTVLIYNLQKMNSFNENLKNHLTVSLLSLGNE